MLQILTMQFNRKKEFGSLPSSYTKTEQRLKCFNISCFIQDSYQFEINMRVKCFTEFLRQKKNEGEKNVAVEYYVCVCVCIKLPLLQGKIKCINIHSCLRVT